MWMKKEKGSQGAPGFSILFVLRFLFAGAGKGRWTI
jgi:hypothetical protein